MTYISDLIKLSRPKFLLYTVSTHIIGAIEAYKQTVFEAETKLNAKRKKLEKDIEELGNTSSNYKLDKLSKDHFLMKKRLH